MRVMYSLLKDALCSRHINAGNMDSMVNLSERYIEFMLEA